MAADLPRALSALLSEPVTRYFERLARETGADSYSLFKLTLRCMNYYAERVEGLTNADMCMWRGACPLCTARLEIDARTGWWICYGCRRSGEMYALEYLLFGQDDPARWDHCRRRADALMRGMPASSLPPL